MRYGLAALAVGGAVAAVVGGLGAGPARVVELEDRISFNRDIRPILSNHCLQCHGPDAATREAGLRLDVRESAVAAMASGARAIVPGDPSASELLRRVTHADDGVLMPPPEIGKPLGEAQIETLRRWIDAGAPYERHWAFVPPERPELPTSSDESWSRNAIDRFVLARLEREGLTPSPEAARSTLLRRASIDLTGLPPSPKELDEYLADKSEDAYERAVDRLLASPRYGEHMARRWLDAARYGDTHGLHLDNAREMWPWRDWVIQAFNSNMPFDRFTVEQLAGDLLEAPTLQQRIATGFNRNHVSTNEGGVIADEVQMNNVADRVSTTGTVWMGLTLSCAHCHDHKYDPINHEEYFELFAFFNNTTEDPLDGNRADWAPFVRVPNPDQQAELASLDARIASLAADLEGPAPEIDAAQEAWRARAAETWRAGWTVPRVVSAASTGGSTLETLPDQSVLASGENPAQDVYEITLHTEAADLSLLRLEALTHESLPHRGAGRAENANFVLSEVELDARPAGSEEAFRPVTLVSAAADHEQMDGPFPASAAVDGVVSETNGWAVEGFARREDRVAVFGAAQPFGGEGETELRVRLRFQTHFAHHAIGRVRLAVSGDDALRETLAPVGLGPWHVTGPFVAETDEQAFAQPFGPEHSPGRFDPDEAFDGQSWRSAPQLADGELHQLEGERCATYLARSVHVSEARRLSLSLGSDDAVKVWLNGELVHENRVARALAAAQDRVEVTLRPGENHLLMKVVNFAGGYGFFFRADDEGAGEYLRVLPAVLAEAPGEDGAVQLRRYYRQTRSPEMRAIAEELDHARAERSALEGALPLTLVMEERAERRPTHRLHRGEYDKPREEVSPGVPEALPPLAEGEPRDRLGLARWLVDPEHPLTARVTVNRLWQQCFGVGLVKTAEDFGSQGEWPSHPELLDWLAVEFVESGWDVKHMLRLIVTSAAYRQSAAVSPELLALDPANRLIARGPRFRLEAEEIRDQALLAGGLLVERVGGPSVKPVQPEGLWEDVAYPDSDTRDYVADEGEARHRRSMYTYWKRTSPPPNLAAFDAPTREACTVRRSRTNTPMQSLVLLNDPQFVEAARALAGRVLRTEGTAEQKLSLAFRVVTSRGPDAEEVAVLRGLYQDLLSRYGERREDALALLETGGGTRDESLDPAEHAAMTAVAGAIFSLDEAQTR